MGSAENQREMTPKGVLVRHPKDLLPLWCDSAKLFRRYKDIVLSFGSTTSLICDIPLAVAHPIL